MKKMRTIKIILRILVWPVVLILALLILQPQLFSHLLFRSVILEPTQLFLSAFALPGDYSEPILNEKLSLSGTVNQIEYKFKVRYVGNKYIRIAMDKNEKLTNKILGGSGYVPGLLCQFKIYDGEKLLWQGETNNKFGPYLDGDEIGFNVGQFNCTRDVPLDSELKLVVDVLRRDEEFEVNNLIRLKIVNYFKE